MPASAYFYIRNLRLLQGDLCIAIKEWPFESSLHQAKEAAEAAAPLIAGEIARLQKAPVKLNPSDPQKLRVQLVRFCNLLDEEGKRKFAEYVAMLDTLIHEGVS